MVYIIWSKKCDFKNLNQLVRKENVHRPNICSCIWKVVFIVPSFSFSFFKYYLLPYSFWCWGKKETTTTIIILDNQFSMKISLNISFQQFLMRLLAENHFLYLCVDMYIHIYLGAPRIWVQDEEYIYICSNSIYSNSNICFLKNKTICMNQGSENW